MQILARLGIHRVHGLRPVALTFAIFAGFALCQSGPPQITVLDTKLRQQYEGRVAHMFESIRKDNGLPKLARISHRHDLEQLVCTAALNDANPWGGELPSRIDVQNI